uniref:Uncharacterized protein n=1 Tax=Anguilla anguilla TaxID=7936 RepID=A0A0E9XU41_ANGAN
MRIHRMYKCSNIAYQYYSAVPRC